MNTNFKIQGLDYEEFSSLFALSDEELAKRNIVRKTVDKAYAFPCRVSLEDAEIGERVLLLSFQHVKMILLIIQQVQFLFVKMRVKEK